MENYYVGQIFEGIYPRSAAEWCNQGNGIIVPYGEGYIIQSLEPHRKELRLTELQAFLDSTDWYVARFAETGVEIPEDIRQQRQEAREEISRLREEKETTPVALEITAIKEHESLADTDAQEEEAESE